MRRIGVTRAEKRRLDELRVEVGVKKKHTGEELVEIGRSCEIMGDVYC